MRSAAAQVRCTGGPFTELGHVATERALVNLAVLGARERHAVVLKLIDGRRRIACEILHRVIVAEPVRPFNGVVHVPLPGIGAHVLERCGDAALRRDGVRAGGEDFCDAGGVEALLGHAEGGAEPGAAGPDDHHVIGVVDDLVGRHRQLQNTILAIDRTVSTATTIAKAALSQLSV